MTEHMRVVHVLAPYEPEPLRRDYYRAQCECGWTSGDLPFPDPDAAYHVGTLHDAVEHPERIDWDKEVARYKLEHGIHDF